MPAFEVICMRNNVQLSMVQIFNYKVRPEKLGLFSDFTDIYISFRWPKIRRKLFCTSN